VQYWDQRVALGFRKDPRVLEEKAKEKAKEKGLELKLRDLVAKEKVSR
jgi:hypothetical protein